MTGKIELKLTLVESATEITLTDLSPDAEEFSDESAAVTIDGHTEYFDVYNDAYSYIAEKVDEYPDDTVIIEEGVVKWLLSDHQYLAKRFPYLKHVVRPHSDDELCYFAFDQRYVTDIISFHDGRNTVLVGADYMKDIRILLQGILGTLTAWKTTNETQDFEHTVDFSDNETAAKTVYSAKVFVSGTYEGGHTEWSIMIDEENIEKDDLVSAGSVVFCLNDSDNVSDKLEEFVYTSLAALSKYPDDELI